MKKSDLQVRIQTLKREKNALILAHNYQLPEIYDIADFVGDSYELSVQAAKTKADLIIFCGVNFMAESAKLLNPKKKVLIPDFTAGCFLADKITAKTLQEKKKQYPKAAVVCYVNSTAEVKAQSDVCVTSANAVTVTKKLKAKQIIFVPDKNLGSFVAEQLPEKEIILWEGDCYVHSKVKPETVRAAQKKHPCALMLAHPECPKAVRALADQVLGTGGMLRFVKASSSKEFLIATESGMLERLKREAPKKKFWSLCGECINMKKITLEKVLHALEEEKFEIKIAPATAQKAKRSLDKMIKYS